MSLRDTIRESVDLESEVVDVPEWDDVRLELRGMTGKQRMKMSKVAQQKGAQDHFYSDMLLVLAFDPETGDPVFDVADRDWLMEKSGAVLDRLIGVINQLSGISSEEAEEAIEADPTSVGD